MTLGAARDKLYTEAVRTALAVSKARAEGSVPDVVVLYQAYLNDARRLGFGDRDAWQMLAVAAIVWVCRLTREQAQSLGVELDELYQDIATETAEWAIARESTG